MPTRPRENAGRSASGEREFLGILRRSQRDFGVLIRDRYRLLVERAYSDLIDDPIRPGVRQATSDLYLYPIIRSRDRVPKDNRIRSPRHIVVFRYDDAQVEIVRLLHDAMDLPNRLT